MRCLLLFLTCVALPMGSVLAQENTDWRVTKQGEIQFAPVEVFLDSGTQSLGAYQLEFSAKGSDVKIVGIEGGEHPAFQEPPHYDPAALRRQRVILAAFSTERALPTGRTRVATVHVQYRGKVPQYSAQLTAAASADGKVLPVLLKLQPKNNP